MTAVIERLDRYWADELGCLPEDLYGGGISVHAPPHREGPRWMGWLVPLECIAVSSAPPGVGVISITPYLAGSLRHYVQSVARRTECLPPSGKGLTPFVREHLPNSYPKIHCILYCTSDSFQPSPSVFPIESLDPDDLHAEWYRYHFDGPVFLARSPGGTIASWAAIKCKSGDIWEMAVATEQPYRGRGLARSVVSCATQAALDAGKLPIYLHDVVNLSSARVCGALGYQLYGHELTCESGRVPPETRKSAGF